MNENLKWNTDTVYDAEYNWEWWEPTIGSSKRMGNYFSIHVNGII